MNASQEFCRTLASDSSDVKAILEEHLEDNDELLPYVFLGAVTRYVLGGGKDTAGIVTAVERAGEITVAIREPIPSGPRKGLELERVGFAGGLVAWYIDRARWQIAIVESVRPFIVGVRGQAEAPR